MIKQRFRLVIQPEATVSCFYRCCLLLTRRMSIQFWSSSETLPVLMKVKRFCFLILHTATDSLSGQCCLEEEVIWVPVSDTEYNGD